jgi:hypothetical protein
MGHQIVTHHQRINLTFERRSPGPGGPKDDSPVRQNWVPCRGVKRPPAEATDPPMLPSDSPTGPGFSDLNRFLTPASLKTQRRQDTHGIESTPRPSLLGVFASLRGPIRPLRGIRGSSPRTAAQPRYPPTTHPDGIQKPPPSPSRRSPLWDRDRVRVRVRVRVRTACSASFSIPMPIPIPIPTRAGRAADRDPRHSSPCRPDMVPMEQLLGLVSDLESGTS